jgi:hypothetical protein
MQLRSKNPGASYSIWLKTLALINLTILSFLFSSCSDDTVSPPKPPVSEFDSARFNWRTVQIPNHGFAGMWAQDTSKIFLINYNNHSLYIESGGIVSIYDFGIYGPNEIVGLSNNEIYIFGTDFNGYMTIIKWNGGSFEYYPTDKNVHDFRYVRGCAINSSEVWILSQGGISKFDGVNMAYYSYEDTLLVPIRLFRTIDYKIQYIATRNTDTTIQQSLFEFQDTGFVKIYNDIRRINPPRDYTFLRVMNGNKFGMELNSPLGLPGSICIKYFTGTSFTDYFCFDSKIQAEWVFRPGYPQGPDLQNFMEIVDAPPPGSVFDSVTVGLIHWNGSKLSKEQIRLNGFESGNDYDVYLLYNVDQFSYLVLEPHWSDWNCTLYIGNKK